MKMNGLNEVKIMGNLGQDPEVKFTPNGKQVTNISVATERGWKPEGSTEWKNVTTWHRVVIWGMEKAVEKMAKGSLVYVSGRIENRSYENKEGQKVYVTEIIAEDLAVIPVERNGEGSGQSQGGSRNSASTANTSRSGYQSSSRSASASAPRSAASRSATPPTPGPMDDWEDNDISF